MRKESVAVAESVTAGLLQFAFSLAENASGFFQGGITAYNLGQKARHLNVDPIHAEDWNCVSLKTAQEMALAVARLFSSKWGIGITGYAAPYYQLKIRKPFAFYALSYEEEVLLSNRVGSTKKGGRQSQEYFVNETLKSFDALLRKI